MSLLRFLGLQKDSPAQEAQKTDTIRRIAQALEAMEPERARYLACFAYILGRVANADLEISPEETREMEQIVMRRGNIPESQAVLVVEIAKKQNILFGYVENYLVTREFNRMATRAEKLALLECLFAVSSSDEEISAVEDREIRQIASELRLDHRDFIAIRSSFRENLSFLKKDKA